MTNLVTLSGNSERFISKNLSHKALCLIDGETMISLFVKSFPDFNRYPSIFLCRQEDLDAGLMSEEIRKHVRSPSIYGIERNSLGPVYSISQIFKKIPDDDSILVSYIDAPQKIPLEKIIQDFSNCESGLSVHDFKNPHWKTSKSYCLVKHNDSLEVKEVIEKFDFSNFDFNTPNAAGSSGSYYFSSGSLMKKEFNKLIQSSLTVNGEYYVTQAVGALSERGAKVKCSYYPYAALGVPEDLEDYEFWSKWFSDK
jgi:bifunctional N-acetylglucosamine-1-phosphate-uridyltransferase/glucosamine-1-phosphate-acetyltransferase GlmU-like protein